MFSLLTWVISESFSSETSSAGSESSDKSVESVVVPTNASASPGKTSGVKTETGVTLGVVTTTHRGPDHELPRLRLAPKASPERPTAAIATTNRALKLLLMLILKSSFSW